MALACNIQVLAVILLIAAVRVAHKFNPSHIFIISFTSFCQLS